MMSYTNPVLISKYDVAVPRYTSYPTVPYWAEQQIAPQAWLQKVQEASQKDPAFSLYIHLPFCESLCTYCGCNKHITKNHLVEMPYIQALLAEWKIYRSVLPARIVLKELHLGGGTPTFFSPESLKYLITELLQSVELDAEIDFGFEAHPWSASVAHLSALADLGFKRISIGVQDFDEALMKVVNRQQSIQSVVDCTHHARSLGYDSVNFDLIYGLPFQQEAHIRKDIDYIRQLKPDRIAFYSYAHIPWLKKSQQAYQESDLPVGAEKRHLYEVGRQLLEELGYVDIGMDHFALPQDALAVAYRDGRLHRNFMGYTTSKTQWMIGLGASAIGDTWNAFAQNEKNIAAYQASVSAGVLPLIKGHFLTEEDQLIRKHILSLMTQYRTQWSQNHPLLETAMWRLEPMLLDGLVEKGYQSVRVTEAGKPFLRNICMAFDAQYWSRQPVGSLFSKAV